MTRARLIAIVRDVAIILGSTAVVGFFVGAATALAHASAEQQHWWLVGSDLLVGTLAFAWVAIHPPREAREVIQTAVLIWILGIFGIALGVYTLSQWGMSAPTLTFECILGLMLTQSARQKPRKASAHGAT
jgi:peptidoglycan/LPS O-acetylase OafA/YrhL